MPDPVGCREGERIGEPGRLQCAAQAPDGLLPVLGELRAEPHHQLLPGAGESDPGLDERRPVGRDPLLQAPQHVRVPRQGIEPVDRPFAGQNAAAQRHVVVQPRHQGEEQVGELGGHGFEPLRDVRELGQQRPRGGTDQIQGLGGQPRHPGQQYGRDGGHRPTAESARCTVKGIVRNIEKARKQT